VVPARSSVSGLRGLAGGRTGGAARSVDPGGGDDGPDSAGEGEPGDCWLRSSVDIAKEFTAKSDEKRIGLTGNN
jgi:hypothetical protein